MEYRELAEECGITQWERVPTLGLSHAATQTSGPNSRATSRCVLALWSLWSCLLETNAYNLEGCERRFIALLETASHPSCAVAQTGIPDPGSGVPQTSASSTTSARRSSRRCRSSSSPPAKPSTRPTRSVPPSPPAEPEPPRLGQSHHCCIAH